MHTTALFFEVGGGTSSYSINYSKRIFAVKKSNAYLRAGVSIWKDQITLPLGLTLITGEGNHHVELTLTLAPISKGLEFWDRDASDIRLDLVFGLGYRYQPAAKAFFISAGIYPHLMIDPTATSISEETSAILLRSGVSLGYFLR